jgi:hypothetical protein
MSNDQTPARSSNQKLEVVRPTTATNPLSREKPSAKFLKKKVSVISESSSNDLVLLVKNQLFQKYSVVEPQTPDKLLPSKLETTQKTQSKIPHKTIEQLIIHNSDT